MGGRVAVGKGPRGAQNPTHIFSEEGLLLLGVLGLWACSISRRR